MHIHSVPWMPASALISEYCRPKLMVLYLLVHQARAPKRPLNRQKVACMRSYIGNSALSSIGRCFEREHP